MSIDRTDAEKNKDSFIPYNQSWWAWLRLILLGIALAGITGTVAIFPLLPANRVALKEKDIAHQDIRAPRSVTYESSILRMRAQEQAVAEVEPIYDQPDPTLSRQQLDRARCVLDYLGSVRADTLASSARQRSWVWAVPELVDIAAEDIGNFISLPDEGWDRVQLETLAALDQVMRTEIREGYVEEAREEIPSLVSLDLLEKEASVTIVLAQSFIVHNSVLNSAATAEAQARAREGVPPVLRSFESGQIVVREGSRVTALNLEALDQLGLRKSQVRWTDFAGVVLLAIVDVLLLGLYLGRFRPEVLWSGRKLLLLTLLLACFVAGIGQMASGGVVLRYLAPTPALAMLAAATLGPHIGAAATLFLGAAVGVIADNSLEMASYVVMGGLVAAFTMKRVERIGALFRAGMFAALTHIVVIFIFRFPQDITQTRVLLVPTLTGVVNGGVSASLALGSLFLVGPLFDITTTMRLVELSRPDHPLLQRLLREAPATYHHSLMVANLAEQAAERIGANPLLARVGAYYHDIGKIARPYFFAENQAEDVNPHDRLDPHASAKIIIDHVEDGLKLARRYRLPSRVRAFISEHHGVNRASFLYSKAVQLADGDDTMVNEDEFRYPGPRPQSKETALVMLGDSCEAAVRAIRPANADEVAKIVAKIVSDRVDDAQLSACDLTLRDLEIIRETFTSVLKGAYHPRIQYPQSEDETENEVSA